MTTVYFDVDDTLIIWPGDITLKFDECEFNIDILGIKYGIHQEMINQLVRHSKIGDEVIVWSAGGKSWAETVIKHLELEKYCNYILSKPTFFYDDNKNPLTHSSRI